mmetsp:Transcript_36023/g.88755  ORF Transcript_36023/g.88755 Transcript_36023/m.88755 type:complete len:231 (-) Transcript_36023:177-869(-)
MNASSTCTALLMMCTWRGLRLRSSGSSTGSRLTSLSVWHPPWEVTRVESNAMSASASGTGASASALMASSSSLGSPAAASCAPMGGEGAEVRRDTAAMTSEESTAGCPPPRIAVMTPDWCERSAASAASTRSDSSTTAVGISPSARSTRSNSATNSGCGSARNTSPSMSSAPPLAPAAPAPAGPSAPLCSRMQKDSRRICAATVAPSCVAPSFASLTRAKSEKRRSSGTR